MPLQIASTEDIYLRLYGKLIKDWIVINGDPGAIISLEYAIYTPGTFKNADLELVILSAFPLRSVIIGRKRPELRNLLKLETNPGRWESLFMLTLKPSAEYMIFETRHLRPGANREQYMEWFARKVLGLQPEGGEVA